MGISQSATRKDPFKKLNLFRVIAVTLITAFLGCGGGGGGNSGATLYSIGGTVSGLAGTGLILQNNGSNNSPVTANGTFALSQPVTKDSAYNVTIFAQPSNPVQTCVVNNGSGTATSNVTSILVVCTTTAYTIGGSVNGLTGSGLVLQDNGGNNLSVTGNGGFTFTEPIDLNDTYNVTVFTQPSNPTQVCTVTDGSGTALSSTGCRRGSGGRSSSWHN